MISALSKGVDSSRRSGTHDAMVQLEPCPFEVLGIKVAMTQQAMHRTY